MARRQSNHIRCRFVTGFNAPLLPTEGTLVANLVYKRGSSTSSRPAARTRADEPPLRGPDLRDERYGHLRLPFLVGGSGRPRSVPANEPSARKARCDFPPTLLPGPCSLVVGGVLLAQAAGGGILVLERGKSVGIGEPRMCAGSWEGRCRSNHR